MTKALGVPLAVLASLSGVVPVLAAAPVALNAGGMLQKAAALSGQFAPGVPAPADLPAPAIKASAPAAAVKNPAPYLMNNGRTMPDFSFTPGKLCTTSDPDFKEYRYPEHIVYCQRNVTFQMKQEVAAHYGIPQSDWPNYEFDHLIPLAIGGNSHVDNLWPQPRTSNESLDKDRLENQLYNEMKAGSITQAEAVRQIYAWFGTTPQ